MALVALVVSAIWPIILGIMWVVTAQTVPLIKVRWVPGVDDDQRTATERELSLAWKQPDEPRTVTYYLLDVDPKTIARIVRHPLVEDTAFIDRVNFVLNNPRTVRTWAGDRFTTPWPLVALYVSIFGFLISGVTLALKD